MGRRLLVAGAAVALGLSSPVAAEDPAKAQMLTPTNYAEGEVVRQGVVLLRGPAPEEATEVVVINESSSRDTRQMRGLVRKGRFLALAELVPGENALILRAGRLEHRLRLVHRPMTNPRYVRCVYLMDRDGETAYQSPLGKDPQDWGKKLATAMKLLQCFTAERMYDLGFGRVAFRIEQDDEGRIPVHLLRGEKTAAEEYRLDDQSWWREVDDLLQRKMPDPNAKNVVVAAYTRFDPEKRKVFGHTALGGGDLGLFGSAGMFAWPSRLQDVFPAFSDTTPVDGTRVHDDSVGRSTHWGLASTTLGAVLHEMGHTFDLPHTNAPMDIMTRGFDHLNRAFCLVEPPPKSGGEPREFRDDEIGCFAPISAASLVANAWFAPDDLKAPVGRSPWIEYDEWPSLQIHAPRGLRFVGLMRDGVEFSYRAYPRDGKPRTMEKISVGDFHRAEGVATHVRIVDAAGAAIGEPIRIPHLYARRWRLSPKPKPWTDPSQFVEASEEDIATASHGEAFTSSTAYLDLLARYGLGSHDVVAYAATSITLPASGKFRLRVGSDDALRLWVDQRLALSRLVHRGATPDDDTVELDLTQGEHRIVAEVSQGVGDWGLYVRLESSQGEPIELDQDGKPTDPMDILFPCSDGEDPAVSEMRHVAGAAGVPTTLTQGGPPQLVLARQSDLVRARSALKADPKTARLLKHYDAYHPGDAPLPVSAGK